MEGKGKKVILKQDEMVCRKRVRVINGEWENEKIEKGKDTKGEWRK